MVYLLRSDGVYVSFDGMTQEQIIAMLDAQGLTCTFMSESDFPTQAVR